MHQVGFCLNECGEILDVHFNLFVHFHDICDVYFESPILKSDTFTEFMYATFCVTFNYAAGNGNYHDIVRSWQRCWMWFYSQRQSLAHHIELYSFIHSFHWHVQNAMIPCRSQDRLPFLSVMYFFLPPFSTNYSSIHSYFILPSVSWSTSQSCCSKFHM